MIVGMSRVRLVGLKSDYDGVIDILTKSKSFEYRKTEVVNEELTEEQLESVRAEQARAAFAIDYIGKLDAKAKAICKKNKNKYVPLKKSGVRDIVDFGAFSLVEEKTDEIKRVIGEITDLSFKQVELKTKITELIAQRKTYYPYSGCQLDFTEIGDTEQTFCDVYYNQRPDKKADLPDETVEVCYNVAAGKVVVVIGFKNQKEQIAAAMSVCGYTKLSLNCRNVDEVIASYDKQINELNVQSDKLVFDGLKYAENLSDLKIYYDLLGIRTQQQVALDNSLRSEYTFMLDGWVPTECAESLMSEVGSKYEVYYSVTEAEIKDEPPTLLRNNAVVQPFENVTAMYTVPNYAEKDPNPHMSIWYFIIFGIMCGDVVYGLALTVACFVLLKIKKFERGTANMIKMFGICGISSMLWGVAFNSYLGFGLADFGIADRFFWFAPLDNAMMLLGLALLVGYLHIFYGYLLGFARCVRQKDILGALFDMGFMIVVMVGIGCLAANTLTGILTKGEFDFSGQYLDPELSSKLSSIGMILLLVAMGGIFLTSGRANKSIMGKLGGGLYGVYGLVNLISDILSYCRLFGLGLAGGAIAYAFNNLITTIFFSNGVAMTIAGSVLLLFLHIFNLALSLLSAYVHNARLQMLEFYGKFLIGDGREFSYVGDKTRFVKY